MPLRFKLIYEGDLPSANKRRNQFKHDLRCKLHAQLSDLWRTHPRLRQQQALLGPRGGRLAPSLREKVGDHEYLPLVSARLDCVVRVDFLVLWQHGGIFDSGGDIDNRIKTLIDGLRLPLESELTNVEGLDRTPDPCFCLMQDDKLLTGFSVDTDRLYGHQPQSSAVVVMDVSMESQSASIWHPLARF